MRLLSITAQKPDSTGSGVYLTELVKGFQRLNIEQAVVAGISRDGTVCLPEGVQVFPVCFETGDLPFPVVGMSDEMPYKSTRYSDMTQQMTRQFKTAFAKRIQEAVREFMPDIILCHHLYFLAAMVREMFPDIPVYGISHGSDLRQIKKNEWQRDYISQWIPMLDGIFALHEEQKEEISRLYQCTRERVRVIGTGYNSDIFYIDDSYPSDSYTNCAYINDTCADERVKEKLNLIFAGKISEKKGVRSLIRSMKYLEERGIKVRLMLVGGAGNEREYQAICEEAQNCPAEVIFTGKLSQEELALRMNQSDVFVLPSFYEGLPLVVVEAMACGLRVVCTDLPGIKSWLDANIPNHGAVFVEPPVMVNEDEPIEEALPLFERRLASAIEEAEKAGLPQREAVERISWSSLCKRLIESMDDR